MQGRQRGLCRHDRMRLVDSNEVIRAQKRRGVHRELFIGAGPRAGKRPVGMGSFECLWGAFPSMRRRGTFFSSPRGNSLTWNWFIVKEIESVLSNNWRGNCGRWLLWFGMVFYERRKGNLFWLSLKGSDQIESINFILLSLIQLFLDLLNYNYIFGKN